MVTMQIAVLVGARLATGGLAEPEVYVGGDASGYLYFDDDGPLLVGGDPNQYPAGGMVPPTWVGYKCKDFPFGCPSGTALVESGNIVGCTFVTPATCTGTCTSCAPGGDAAYLCQRDPAASCELNTSAGGLSPCGSGQATVACGYIAPPSTASDPRGCSCPAAGTYAGLACKVNTCVP
jgi:hypothetical protein